jgi:hypothetical protein
MAGLVSCEPRLKLGNRPSNIIDKQLHRAFDGGETFPQDLTALWHLQARYI